MQDRVLGLLIFVPVAIIIMLVGSMVMMDYFVGDSLNPLGAIPKVIIDHSGNETIVTVKAVGERRYDAIHINYTIGNQTHHNSVHHRYVLDAGINAPSFILNITVLRGDDHYFFNCSIQVDMVPGDPVAFWVMEEDDDEHTRHRSPFKTLAEWRKIK